MSERSMGVMIRRDFFWIGIIALATLALDFLSKYWVYTQLRFQPPLTVIPGFLQFVYGENTGIAFGLFQNQGYLLHIVTPVAFMILLAILYLQFANERMDATLIAVFGLIIGGALGNILNRIYSGYVIDFIDAYYGTWHFYTFNLADSALTVGEVLLFGKLLFQSGKSAEPKPSETNPAAQNENLPASEG